MPLIDPHEKSFADLVAKENEQLGEKSHFSLAISGGGIRSATFALGILQFLAKRRLIRKLDYISTVSGGGYIGSWLTAWIHNEARNPSAPADAPAVPVQEVERRLVPPPDDGNPQREAEDKTITWLRQYGKYLSPNLALFSADSWLIGTIWARNTLLLFLIITSLVAALLTLPWILQALYLTYRDITIIPKLIAYVLDMIGIIFAWEGLPRSAGGRYKFLGQPGGFISAILVVFSSILFVFAPHDGTREMYQISAVAGAILGFWATWAMLEENRRWSASLRLLLGILISAAGFPFLEFAAARAIAAAKEKDLLFLVPVFGPQIVTLFIGVVVALLIGIAGWRQKDIWRESWSRIGAWMCIFGSGGLALAMFAIFGPVVFYFLYAQTYLWITTGALWIFATAMGVLIGRSSGSTGDKASRVPILDYLLPLTPIIFVTGYLILASTGAFSLMYYMVNGSWPGIVKVEAARCLNNCVETFLSPSFVNVAETVFNHYAKLADTLSPIWPSLGFFLIATGLYFLLSRLIDINEFSLHQFYRNRLVRAYQGASNKYRNPDWFTNLDPEDDTRLMSLRSGPAHPSPQPRRPIHLINTAVNLNLAATGLDERRAASFVFTPYGCGYTMPLVDCDVANQPPPPATAYADPDAMPKGEFYRLFDPDNNEHSSFRLGIPITISGAAASPNMGYHTSAMVAFLLSLFNVRLGFWIFNTSDLYFSLSAWLLEKFRPGLIASGKAPEEDWLGRFLYQFVVWNPQGPRLAAFYYMFELLGLANQKKYVYLSDGGHFENLAVYELLRRRSKYIICIDAEEDAGMKFEGLGGLIRKARYDLGITIDIDTSSIEERSEEGWSGRHCASGTIWYPEEEHPTGILLYLKLSVTGDEPTDIMHYRKVNPVFPHQSTADQFFTESQFESYRALGFHVAETAFKPVSGNRVELHEIFADLKDFWTGVPRNLSVHFTRNTKEFINLLGKMRDEKGLWFLNKQFDPDWPASDRPDFADEYGIPADIERYTRAYYYCHQLIQLMENVYVDLDLESNYKHPVFAGWLEQFQRWASSPMFHHTYEKTKDTFGPLFCNFYERLIMPPAYRKAFADKRGVKPKY